MTQEATIQTLYVRLHADAKDDFINWQSRLNEIIVAFPDFISLEIQAPSGGHMEWIIVQRFQNAAALETWIQSKEHATIMSALKPLLERDSSSSYSCEMSNNSLA